MRISASLPCSPVLFQIRLGPHPASRITRQSGSDHPAMPSKRRHSIPARLSRVRRIFLTSKPPAAPPGQPTFDGVQRSEKVSISIARYKGEKLEIRENATVEDCEPLRDSDDTVWIHVAGLHQPEVVSRIGELFGMHSLLVEDVLNTRGRPKFEETADQIFVCLKILYTQTAIDINVPLDAQHGCVFFCGNTVLSFSEDDTEVLEPLYRRLRRGTGRLRHATADYLMWAVLDAIVDHYFVCLDHLDQHVNHLEDMVQEHYSEVELYQFMDLKKEIAFVSRLVRPARDISISLERSLLISDSNRPFFRDLYDHAIHIVEHTEYLRDLSATVRDLYLAMLSNRMNSIMTVLTCFATIFLPLTFIAGIYGMNFDFMPELRWKWAYPALWAVFILVGGAMFIYFKRKKWL